MKKTVKFPFLGSEEDYLVYTYRTLAEAEERHGKELMKSFYGGHFDMRFLIAYLPVGLKKSRLEQGCETKDLYDNILNDLDEKGEDFAGMISAIIDAIRATGIFHTKETQNDTEKK